MYKSSEEVLDKLLSGGISLNTITRNMNKHLHKGNIDQWLVFAKAKALYKMEKLGVWQRDMKSM